MQLSHSTVVSFSCGRFSNLYVGPSVQYTMFIPSYILLHYAADLNHPHLLLTGAVDRIKLSSFGMILVPIALYAE